MLLSIARNLPAYHAAQTLVRYAERNLAARPGDVPDNLTAEFDRAVLGATA